MVLSMTGAISIGVDLATANARVVALESSAPARILAEASAPLAPPRYGPNGLARQNPDYWQVSRDLIAQVCAALGPRAGEVTALSVTATSGTVVGLDLAGVVFGEALLYSDSSGTRFRQALAGWNSDSRPTTSLERMGILAEDSRVARIVTSADVVAHGLLGTSDVPSDSSHTLKAGGDPRGLAWPKEGLRRVGVASELVPTLVAPGTILGELAAQNANLWGLRGPVVVVAGMTDGCTSHIATGGLSLGDTVGIVGTTLVLKAVADTDIRHESLGVYSHQSPDGFYFPGGASNIGGGSLPPGLDSAEIDQRTTNALSHGITGPVVYPLPRTGERFPFSDPNAVALGMTDGASPNELFHAVIQAVAFTERWGLDVLSGLGVVSKRHFVSGGAARSIAMNQLRASVLAREIFVPHFNDSAVGAALLAAASVSGLTVNALTDEVLPPPRVVTPRDDWVKPAEQRYQDFLALLAGAGYL